MSRLVGALLIAAGVGAVLLGSSAQQSGPSAGETWQSLFDGKTFGHWKRTEFFKPGPVEIENGQIILSAGDDLTGITWNGPALPTTNYEIALEAMRIEGSDFFAGVTFPVDDSFCTLVVGGWGGSIVGLSSIDGVDASENQTTRSIIFEDKRWYRIRIRVTPAKIEAWLDDNQIVNQIITGRDIYTRIEVDASQPLGVASWRTKAAIRDLRHRPL